MQLKQWSSPILGKTVKEVPDQAAAIKLPIKRMIATCQKENGVGLAANQVGLDARVVVIAVDHRSAFYMINPKIDKASDELVSGKEGCLSYPRIFADVERSKEIEVTWRDLNWKLHRQTFKDYDARVIQHELDHLDGICKVGDEWRRQKENA